MGPGPIPRLLSAAGGCQSGTDGWDPGTKRGARGPSDEFCYYAPFNMAPRPGFSGRGIFVLSKQTFRALLDVVFEGPGSGLKLALHQVQRGHFVVTKKLEGR